MVRGVMSFLLSDDDNGLLSGGFGHGDLSPDLAIGKAGEVL
jgi:hypothetical protein